MSRFILAIIAILLPPLAVFLNNGAAKAPRYQCSVMPGFVCAWYFSCTLAGAEVSHR
jgi:hypothetical protein